MTGLGILAILWIGGIAAYFYFTTEDQRHNMLLIAWVVILLPAFIPIFKWLAG